MHNLQLETQKSKVKINNLDGVGFAEFPLLNALSFLVYLRTVVARHVAMASTEIDLAFTPFMKHTKATTLLTINSDLPIPCFIHFIYQNLNHFS